MKLKEVPEMSTFPREQTSNKSLI